MAQGPSVQAPGRVVAGSPLGSPLGGCGGDLRKPRGSGGTRRPVCWAVLWAPGHTAQAPAQRGRGRGGSDLGGLPGSAGPGHPVLGPALGGCVHRCLWRWWAEAAAPCSVVTQGSSETAGPVDTLGWPVSLRSLPVAGVGPAWDVAWPESSGEWAFSAILRQGPKGSGHHDTPCCPPFRKCSPSETLRLHTCGKAQRPPSPALP